jgi:hypothetical protein
MGAWKGGLAVVGRGKNEGECKSRLAARAQASADWEANEQQGEQGKG